jgi:hypothetical protein
MKLILKNIAIGIYFVLLSNTLFSQSMKSKEPIHKVVFQFSTNDTLQQKALIKQLDNLLKAMDPIVIEVVAHGPGVELFVSHLTKYENNLKALNDKGIRFLICRNTLNEKKIKPEQLIPFAEVIPAGIAHLIIRQEEGWSYIKAGF